MNRVICGICGAAVFALASLPRTTARAGGDLELRESIFQASSVFGVVETVPDVPAAGCVVRFMGPASGNGLEQQTAVCDGRGYFILKIVSAEGGLSTFRFEMPSHKTISPLTASFCVQPSLAASVGANSALHGGLLSKFPPATDLGVIRLTASGGIAGRIVGGDAETLSTAAIQLEGTGNVVTPNSLGAFSFQRVSPGRHVVVLLVPGRAPQRRIVNVAPAAVAMGATFEAAPTTLVAPELPMPGQGKRFR